MAAQALPQLVQTYESSVSRALETKGHLISKEESVVRVGEREVVSESGEKLVVSPYPSDAHLLDLSTVSVSCQLLARALTEMEAVRSDYATAPYTEAFNWSVVLERLKALVAEASHDWKRERFYIVVFRSQIPPTTSRQHLGGLDARSHAEAMASGGLLKYWFGTPDESGRNLATCLWRDIKDAKKGGNGPGHRQAAKETRELYTEWHIERLQLVVEDAVESWEIAQWTH